MMTEKVLVTGGFGLVGSQTVRRLAIDGHHVVATDLGTPAQRKAAASLPATAEARWANLTNEDEVDQLVAEVSPTAIVHLAAVIPPAVYRNRELGRRVNVDATAALLRAAGAPTASALRAGFQQCGLRVTQSTSPPGTVVRRLSAAAGGSLRLAQGGGGKIAASFEFGVGDPAPRRGAQ
jgi:NAD(P)-dependent dehydrogenase (short-subunit alcohol dehydrogenase family)